MPRAESALWGCSGSMSGLGKRSSGERTPQMRVLQSLELYLNPTSLIPRSGVRVNKKLTTIRAGRFARLLVTCPG